MFSNSRLVYCNKLYCFDCFMEVIWKEYQSIGTPQNLNIHYTDIKFRWKDQALAEHEEMSRLFKENRFKFELERKNAIEATINKVENKGHRKNLRQLQKKWDNILKNSGSRHNRFVLIQMLFWDQVNNNYRPALNCLR